MRIFTYSIFVLHGTSRAKDIQEKFGFAIWIWIGNFHKCNNGVSFNIGSCANNVQFYARSKGKAFASFK